MLRRSLGGFARPDDVAVRADGARLVVLDTNAHKFRWETLPQASSFQSGGGYVSGVGPGFAFPEAAFFDPGGSLVVLDLWNRRVVRYMPQGSGYVFDAAFPPASGIAVGGVTLGYVRDVAADSAARLYVLDPQNGAVQIGYRVPHAR